MIVTKFALRVSLIGGGTDISSFYKENGFGEVISFPIDKFIYLLSNKYYDKNKLSFKYSEVEEVEHHSKFKNPILRSTINKYFPDLKGREFASFSEIPGGTGLGSSSSFTNAMISHLFFLQNKKIEKLEIAKKSYDIEVGDLNYNIGKQDHYATISGGMKKIKFYDNESVDLKKIDIHPDFENILNKNMVLVRIGDMRSASDLLKEITNDKNTNFIRSGKKMLTLVAPLNKSLEEGSIDDFASIINEGWHYKKEMSPSISNSNINDFYEQGLKNGALCGKLCGAGKTGFIFFLCHDTNMLIKYFNNIETHRISICGTNPKTINL